MSSQFLIDEIRRQLEQEILEKVRDAEKAYRDAVAESKQLVEYSSSPERDRPESAKEIQEIAAAERSSLQKYGRMLGLFTELVVNIEPSRDRLLNIVLDTAIEIGGADNAFIQVLDSRPGLLRIEAHRGFERPFLEHFAHVRQEDPCGVAFQTARRVIVEDITKSPLFAGTAFLKVFLDAGMRSLQCTPLVSRDGHTLGTLSTHYCRATRLRAKDLSLLDRLSTQAAAFIEVYPAH